MRWPNRLIFCTLPLILAAADFAAAAPPPQPAVRPEIAASHRGAKVMRLVSQDTSETRSREPGDPDTATDLPLRPATRPAAISRALTALLAVPLGAGWSAHPARERECEPFRWRYHNELFFMAEDDWVYRCATTIAGGTLEQFFHLAPESDTLRLLHVRWVSAWLPEGQDSDLDPLIRAWGDSLAARLQGSGPSLRQNSAVYVDGVLQKFARSGEILRICNAEDAEAGRFIHRAVAERWQAGFLQQVESQDTTHVEHAEERTWIGRIEAQESLRAQVVRALASERPRLAAAVHSPKPNGEQVEAVRQALLDSARRAASTEQYDLLTLAAHLWLQGIGVVRGTDAQRVASVLGPLGAQEVQAPGFSAVGVCIFKGRWPECSKGTPGENRWTDWAFWGTLNAPTPDSTGEDSNVGQDGPDLFKAVIARGEPFLASHPHSQAWCAVALEVAGAHETAWSLSKYQLEPGEEFDPECGPFVNPADYALEAAAHRDRALEIYRQVLPTLGDGPGARLLKRRIFKLARDVDTGFHVFYSPPSCC